MVFALVSFVNIIIIASGCERKEGRGWGGKYHFVVCRSLSSFSSCEDFIAATGEGC